MAKIQSKGPYRDLIQIARSGKQVSVEADQAVKSRQQHTCAPMTESYNQKEIVSGEETLELSGGTNQRSNPNHGWVIRGLALVHDKNTLFRPPTRPNTMCFFCSFTTNNIISIKRYIVYLKLN